MPENFIDILKNFINTRGDLILGMFITLIPTIVLERYRYKKELIKLGVVTKEKLISKLETKAEQILKSNIFYSAEVDKYKLCMKYGKTVADTYLVPVTKEFKQSKNKAATFLHLYFPELIDAYNDGAEQFGILSGFVFDCAKKDDFSKVDEFDVLLKEYYDVMDVYTKAIITTIEKERTRINKLID